MRAVRGGLSRRRLAVACAAWAGLVPAFAAAPAEQPARFVRETAQVNLGASRETWSLEWRGAPEPGCGPKDPSAFTCECRGFAYGEKGVLELVRRRADGAEDRLDLSRYFEPPFAPGPVIPRWPQHDGDVARSGTARFDEAVRARGAVRVLDIADFDHDGTAAEFVLHTANVGCRGAFGVLVGLGGIGSGLHVFGSRDAPAHPLLLDLRVWEALRSDDGPVRIVTTKCGEDGSPVEVEVEARSAAGDVQVVERRFSCEGGVRRAIAAISRTGQPAAREEWLRNLGLDDAVISEDAVRTAVLAHDLALLWTSTDSRYVFGFIGAEYERFDIHVASAVRDERQPGTYRLTGMTRTRGRVCTFTGSAEVVRAAAGQAGVPFPPGDPRGTVTWKVTLREDGPAPEAGDIEGTLVSEFVISDGHLVVDDRMGDADGYSNNAFVGRWSSRDGKVSRPCHWGDYRVPDSGDLDTGAGAFHPNERYRRFGWDGFSAMDPSDQPPWWDGKIDAARPPAIDFTSGPPGDPRERYDSAEGTYTLDLACDGTATVALALPPSTLRRIADQAANAGFFELPADSRYRPAGDIACRRHPCFESRLRITNGARSHEVVWDTCRCELGVPGTSAQSVADALREAIQAAPEYQHLPEVRCSDR